MSTNKKKILIFGDSWGYGSELDLSREKNFGNNLKDQTNIDVYNYSSPGLSFPHIVSRVINNIHLLGKDVFVIVIIPPDCRWIAPSDDFKKFKTLVFQEVFNKEDIPQKYYNNYLLNSPYWFNYHFSLFLFTLQCLLDSKNTAYIFQHNYGKLELLSNFKELIKKEAFLDFNRSLTSILVDKKDIINLIKNKLDGILDCKENFSGKFFYPNISHPNELGHRKIAEIILENERFKKWLM